MLTGTVEATIAILFTVVALGPIIAERFKIPGLVGLIAGGVVFGPYVIGWIDSGGLVDELGSIGILFLMFLAGLSFDIRAFFANRSAAITYGLLGFVFPFVLSVVVISRSEDIQGLGALLIGAMWASNTLVAYPEVQSAGLQRTRSVGAAVSAGVVADLLSLTVMAFATASAVIEIDPVDVPILSDLAGKIATDDITPSTSDPLLPLWLGLPLLAGCCLWLLPRVARWFFVRVGRTRPQRVVFALALMGAGSVVAKLGGMEGLIGAFLTGLGLNSFVPSRGPLMERLDFVGTTIFVPTFLVSIGLSIDPALLVDAQTIKVALLFTGFVVVGKAGAALVTGLVFKYSRDEIGLMSTLSFGQAASTLAIADVGSGLGMFGQTVVNAAVLAIVLTAFITSYGTRYFAQRVPPPHEERPPIGQQVLLDTRGNGSDTAALVALAAGLARADDGVVRPFGIASGSQQVATRALIDRVSAEAAAIGLDVDPLMRVDDSYTEATVNLVAETEASMLLLDWAGPHWALDYLLGNDIDGVGGASPVPAVAAHVLRPWTRVVVRIGDPETSWEREDAALATSMGMLLQRAVGVPMVLQTDDRGLAVECLGGEPDPERVIIAALGDGLADGVDEHDLVIVPAHLVRRTPPWRARRLLGVLEHLNLVVVAGPHRLTISRGVTGRPLATAINATTEPD